MSTKQNFEHNHTTMNHNFAMTKALIKNFHHDLHTEFFLSPSYIGTCCIQGYSSLSMREQFHIRNHTSTVFVACIFVSDTSHPGIHNYNASWDNISCDRHNILVDSNLQNNIGTEKESERKFESPLQKTYLSDICAP